MIILIVYPIATVYHLQAFLNSFISDKNQYLLLNYPSRAPELSLLRPIKGFNPDGRRVAIGWLSENAHASHARLSPLSRLGSVSIQGGVGWVQGLYCKPTFAQNALRTAIADPESTQGLENFFVAFNHSNPVRTYILICFCNYVPRLSLHSFALAFWIYSVKICKFRRWSRRV